MTLTPFDHMLDEHRALVAHYGRAQLRCTDLLAAQAREIARLQADAVRLRAEVIVRETALAYEREDRATLVAAMPGLPRRKALARQVDGLALRIQELMREVLHWQWRAGGKSPAHAAPVSMVAGTSDSAQDLAVRSVLCIAQDTSGALVTQRMVDSVHGLASSAVAMDALLAGDAADHEALEASLVAADLVICQTGCLGHNAYWRVQDHCKRTGKPCVLVDQPQVMHFMRGLSRANAAVAADRIPG